MSVTQRLLVQTLLWSLDVLSCAHREKGILFTFVTSPSWNWVPAFYGSWPAMYWCPCLWLQWESIALICLTPQKLGISIGPLHLLGSEKDLTDLFFFLNQTNFFLIVIGLSKLWNLHCYHFNWNKINMCKRLVLKLSFFFLK